MLETRMQIKCELYELVSLFLLEVWLRSFVESENREDDFSA